VGLSADAGPGDVAIDTAIVIYFIEESTRYLPLVLPLFLEANEGRRTLVTSSLTLLEVLVVPYRAGNRQLALEYERLLTGSRGLRLIDFTRDHLRAAAHLRATTGVKTPDALQLAVAIGAGCRAFITNDRRLSGAPGIRVLQLSDYLPHRE
jgi:predicted nucleic acid-binding protein